MTHTYINVPDARADYAQGYTQDGKPIRMTGGMLGSRPTACGPRRPTCCASCRRTWG